MSKFDYNSNLSNLIQAILSSPESLSDKTKLIEAVTAFETVQMAKIQQRKEDEKRGDLMNDIYKVCFQLGINTDKLRKFKGMTTEELEDMVKTLYKQLDNSPVKSLKIA